MPARDATLIVSPVSVNFDSSAMMPQKHVISLKNIGNKDLAFRVSVNKKYVVVHPSEGFISTGTKSRLVVIIQSINTGMEEKNRKHGELQASIGLETAEITLDQLKKFDPSEFWEKAKPQVLLSEELMILVSRDSVALCIQYLSVAYCFFMFKFFLLACLGENISLVVFHVFIPCALLLHRDRRMSHILKHIFSFPHTTHSEILRRCLFKLRYAARMSSKRRMMSNSTMFLKGRRTCHQSRSGGR